ncbi:hypothetical protein [Mammaliicoccus lentus]|uniref:hypothetical protein n=1 Tax=Mammaliicoccus lentus TaxID=42858 RepID=UPI0010724966|nr:hypothetical protein [Mammaliicoccus lentus]MBF0793367.1 hypothetical protein [Mammaliicoccus lentus]TFV17868.1 hypothetical protein E4T78_01790 [Mammaliicoccus lentus]
MKDAREARELVVYNTDNPTKKELDDMEKLLNKIEKKINKAIWNCEYKVTVYLNMFTFKKYTNYVINLAVKELTRLGYAAIYFNNDAGQYISIYWEKGE